MTDFQLKDTIRLQIQSVVNFMQNLGYVPYRFSSKMSFINAHNPNSANNVISWENAVRMHNGTLDDWQVLEGVEHATFDKVKLNTMWPVMSVILADASKLVVQTKVGFNRKGDIVVNSANANLVKAANPAVEALIGK